MEAHQLTPLQIEALDWIVREAIDAAAERDLAPKDALSEAQDLLVAAQLTGNEELMKWSLDLVDKARVRVDALAAMTKPKPTAEELLATIRHQVALGLGSGDPTNWEAALQDVNNTIFEALGPED